MKQDKKRVNTLMPADVVKKLDNYANELGLSRGNALTVIVKHYFDEQEGLKAIRNVDDLLKELKSNQK